MTEYEKLVNQILTIGAGRGGIYGLTATQAKELYNHFGFKRLSPSKLNLSTGALFVNANENREGYSKLTIKTEAGLIPVSKLLFPRKMKLMKVKVHMGDHRMRTSKANPGDNIIERVAKNQMVISPDTFITRQDNSFYVDIVYNSLIERNFLHLTLLLYRIRNYDGMSDEDIMKHCKVIKLVIKKHWRDFYIPGVPHKYTLESISGIDYNKYKNNIMIDIAARVHDEEMMKYIKYWADFEYNGAYYYNDYYSKITNITGYSTKTADTISKFINVPLYQGIDTYKNNTADANWVKITSTLNTEIKKRLKLQSTIDAERKAANDTSRDKSQSGYISYNHNASKFTNDPTLPESFTGFSGLADQCPEELMNYKSLIVDEPDVLFAKAAKSKMITRRNGLRAYVTLAAMVINNVKKHFNKKDVKDKVITKTISQDDYYKGFRLNSVIWQFGFMRAHRDWAIRTPMNGVGNGVTNRKNYLFEHYVFAHDIIFSCYFSDYIPNIFDELNTMNRIAPDRFKESEDPVVKIPNNETNLCSYRGGNIIETYLPRYRIHPITNFTNGKYPKLHTYNLNYSDNSITPADYYEIYRDPHSNNSTASDAIGTRAQWGRYLTYTYQDTEYEYQTSFGVLSMHVNAFNGVTTGNYLDMDSMLKGKLTYRYTNNSTLDDTINKLTDNFSSGFSKPSEHGDLHDNWFGIFLNYPKNISITAFNKIKDGSTDILHDTYNNASSSSSVGKLVLNSRSIYSMASVAYMRYFYLKDNDNTFTDELDEELLQLMNHTDESMIALNGKMIYPGKAMAETTEFFQDFKNFTTNLDGIFSGITSKTLMDTHASLGVFMEKDNNTSVLLNISSELQYDKNGTIYTNKNGMTGNTKAFMWMSEYDREISNDIVSILTDIYASYDIPEHSFMDYLLYTMINEADKVLNIYNNHIRINYLYKPSTDANYYEPAGEDPTVYLSEYNADPEGFIKSVLSHVYKNKLGKDELHQMSGNYVDTYTDRKGSPLYDSSSKAYDFNDHKYARFNIFAIYNYIYYMIGRAALASNSNLTVNDIFNPNTTTTLDVSKLLEQYTVPTKIAYTNFPIGIHETYKENPEEISVLFRIISPDLTDDDGLDGFTPSNSDIAVVSAYETW